MKTLACFLLIITIFTNVPVFAQERGVVNKPINQTSEKRLALVIGNSGYQFTDKLKNPVNDASDVAASLKKLGFEVISGTDLNLAQMRKLVREFGAKLQQQKGVGLFYYAGHGVQVGGRNYLIPIDANIETETETSDYSLDADLVLRYMRDAGNEFNMVILDACRNNPFVRSWRQFSPNRNLGDEKGLAKITPPSGTIILYATEPGSVASDGTGRNGLFTESFLTQINKANVEFDQMVKLLARDIKLKSNNKQSPWKEGLYDGEFYFKIDGVSQTVPKPTPTASQRIVPNPLPTPTPIPAIAVFDAEEFYWNEIVNRDTKSGYELYLDEYPRGKYVSTAKNRISEFNNQESLRLKNIEKNKWQEASRQNTKESFNSYLSIYPNGEFASSARQKIKEFDDEEARKQVELENQREETKWEEVSLLNRKTAYLSYLSAYPKGKYAAIAKSKLKEFEAEEARVLLAQQKAIDKNAWEQAEKLKSEKSYAEYLKFYPRGDYASLARLRLNDLGKPVKQNDSSNSPKPEKQKVNTPTSSIGKNITDSIGMEFMYIPAGSFEMGSPRSEKQRNDDEGPQRRVTIADGFWLGKYEVTQAEYEKVMETNPSYFKDCPRCPVEQVSWNDAQEFIKKLNTLDSQFEYSLPSEAEWEYAARAGTTTAFAFGDSLSSNEANFNGNYPFGNAAKGKYLEKTVNVGSYQANNFGLSDMHGNVWEWTQDIYNASYSGLRADGSSNGRVGNSGSRVLRGGSWNYGGYILRSASRVNIAPDVRDNVVGFRVAVRPR